MVKKRSQNYLRKVIALISIFNNPKIYKRCYYDQMSNYFEDIFSKNQCGFRNGYSAQHCFWL